MKGVASFDTESFLKMPCNRHSLHGSSESGCSTSSTSLETLSKQIWHKNMAGDEALASPLLLDFAFLKSRFARLSIRFWNAW